MTHTLDSLLGPIFSHIGPYQKITISGDFLFVIQWVLMVGFLLPLQVLGLLLLVQGQRAPLLQQVVPKVLMQELRQPMPE